MGGKASRPLPFMTESAKEVIARRKDIVPGGVLGLPRRKKVEINEFNEQLHNEMTKVLNVKTVHVSMKSMIDKGSKTNAHLIRYHRDNEIEKDRETGIVRGRTQLSESDLMALFEAHRDQEDNWQPTAMAKELNVPVEEVLDLVKSARLPVYHRRTDGAIQAH